ncbi:MAG: hydroxyethylthiazole kinase [Bacillota bacterium]|nr:hydroxyethylthiazole kinase [Bacillota bacterium]MDK2925185.1 hydroxyethylthiazole kinase [Bacillota bacterium]
MTLEEKAGAILEKIREERPLVHHVTNIVVANITANITLAFGAAPVMADAPEEVEDMVAQAQALVLNTGTPSRAGWEAMLRAGRAANRSGIPVVLDPVGVGATQFRKDLVHELVSELKFAVIRGNLAEMGMLAGEAVRPRGVDSRLEEGARAEDENWRAKIARAVAERFQTVAVVTGRRDFVASGRRLARVENGHPLLTAITGSGCMATAVIGAWVAVAEDAFLAAYGALAAYGVAAELAAEKAGGPGTFQAYLFDAAHHLTGEVLAQRARVALL